MKSDEVTIIFPPIKLEEPLNYLKNLRYSYLISGFFKLSEKEMLEYETPSSILSTRREIEDSCYSKDSDTYIEFNTFVTTYNLIRKCLNLNSAINTLREKYKLEEIARKRYRQQSPFDSLIHTVWYRTSDPDALEIKRLAISAKERIQGYNKKYVTTDFENLFINKIKYQVYVICDRFRIDTRTLTEKTTDTGINLLIYVIGFVVLCVVFYLIGKFASAK